MSKQWSFRAIFLGAFASVLFSAALPKVTLAQGNDCGTNCGSCGTGKKEGYGYNELGEYNMSCAEAVTGCFRCWGGQHTLVREAPNSANALLRAVRTSSLDGLIRLAPTLKGQVYLHRQRNLVAVRGEACAKDRVVALAFLSEDRIDALARGGVGDLTSFLAQAPVVGR